MSNNNGNNNNKDDNVAKNEEKQNEGNPKTDDSLSHPDPNNFSVKHPLQNKWTMWWDSSVKKSNQSNWSNNLKPLLDFDTVEDFWSLYNNIKTASQLPHGSNYHLFKYGVKPEWEDKANENGGKWMISYHPKSKLNIDDFWLNTLLVCIGEGFGDYEDEICGVVISLRKSGDRIALWTKHWNKEEATMEVGRIFKSNVSDNNNAKIGYQRHEDAKASRKQQDNYYEV